MILTLLSLLFHSEKVYAADRPWPSDDSIRLAFFTPDGPDKFADAEGLEGIKRSRQNREDYRTSYPVPRWTERRSCDAPMRGSGYIQTTKFVVDEDTNSLQIAVPFFFSLRTSFLGTQKRNLLSSNLLTISILTFHADTYELRTGSEFRLSIKELCELDPSCRPALNNQNLPINISHSGPVFTPNLPVLPNTEIRILVSWSSQGICNEESVNFKMGNQVRILFPVQ
jgi:hypothetical protein